MEFVNWSFGGVHLLMLDLGGQLFCTSSTLRVALGCSRQNISQICKRYPEFFGKTAVNFKLTQKAREELDAARDKLGVRIKSETLFTEQQAIFLAMSSRSPRRFEFVSSVLDLVKQHAVKGRLSKEDSARLQQDMAQLRADLDAVQHRLAISQPVLAKTSTLIGQALQAYKTLSTN